MQTSVSADVPVIDFAMALCRARGIGDALMRKQRLAERQGYIACSRLRLAQELERETGQREPHW